MDVCSRGALEMRRYKGKKIEGERLFYLEFDSFMNYELQPEEMMTFPFMNYSESCNGCMICVDECPVEALAINIDENTEEIEWLSNR